MNYPFEPISPWWKAPEDVQPQLEGSAACEVAVIGGGYTGLSTALHLKAAGIDVALLEKGICGSGSSGRNAGHLTPTIGKDLPSILKVFGEEKAGRLIRFAEDAVRHTEALIGRYGLECGYHANGNIMAAVDRSQEKALRRSAEAAYRLGAEMQFLEVDAMRSRGLPDRFLSGTLDRLGGVLHPGRLVHGLRRRALSEGVRIYENSPVSKIKEGKKVGIDTSDGVLNAERVVLATNAYTPSLGLLRRKVAPVVVTLLETAPMTAVQREAIGWPGREGIYTAHEILESYHLTERNTIVAGSKQIAIPYGSKLKTTRREQLFRKTTMAFRERFPQLSELPVASYWGGYIGFTTDFIPVLGTTGRHQNIHYGIGFAGHGVAQGLYMGSVLGAMLTGREHPASDLLMRKTIAWPPEPVRWAGGQLIRGILTAMDARVDRRIRRTNT